jgi:ABC-type amino acid transport substrate-binding protein
MRKWSLFLLVVLVGLVPLSAQKRTVRIGCADIEKFFVTAKDGTVSGYGIDYLNEIAKETDWDYTYVHGTWSKCLQWLKEGSIDMLLPAEYSEERAEEYLFSRNQCCIDFVALLARADDDALLYEDWENYPALRVGVMKGNYLNGVFADFAKEKGLTYTIVPFPDNQSMRKALEEKKIDVLVNGNFNSSKGQKVLALISALPAYFIFNKNSKELVGELDNAIDKISLNTPYFTAKLADKYYGITSSMGKGYTRAEHDYIMQSPPLRIVGDRDNYPLVWYDEKEKQLKGIERSVIDLLSEKSGLPVTYVPTDNLALSYDILKQGDADLLAGIYVEKHCEKIRCHSHRALHLRTLFRHMQEG